MRPTRLLLLALFALAAACAGGPRSDPAPAAAPIVKVDWDSAGVLTRGIPCDTPVVVRASSDRRATREEYAFLRRHYPGYRMGSQALLLRGGRPMDLLTFAMPEGAEYSVCFDISNSFGHP